MVSQRDAAVGAILLAAGRGRRLGVDEPKCLLEIGGRTLLDRHVEHLVACGVPRLTIVVGHKKDLLEPHIERLRSHLPIDVIDNPRFERGSIVSLYCAGERLKLGAVVMDADVLYPRALLERLIKSPHENCVLLDARSDETGEEMMLGVREGRVQSIARRVGEGWDVRGESVGFAKYGPSAGQAMLRVLTEEVSAERLDQEYEAALDRVFKQATFGFEPVDEFEWTEIDFVEDVDNANQIARRLD